MPPTYTPEEMIAKLVGFDTTSRNSNLELISFVADYLRGLGIESELYHDATGTKANLYATIGPRRDGGVVLSGHTDVVPVDGQAWTSDPFTVVERDGRLHGRGTADMKSFCAVALALVPEFLAAGLELPIHLAFSYDEEVGCIGVRGMLPHVALPGLTPQAVIVGEPTGMKVVNTHKGIRSFWTTVTGLEAHSSATHRGVNAVMIAAELIGFLARLAEEERSAADPDSPFDPPYTTVNVGPIEGGTALNIIPRHCKFVWEYRLIPGNPPDAIIDRFVAYAEQTVLPRMRAVSPDAAIVTEPRAWVPPLRAESGSPAESLVLALTGSNRSHAVSYGTEAGLFREAGLPAVICGPGDIAQAHRPDEYISREQVAACVEFMRRLGAHLSAR
jgi:acetylornithine deacetylase